jgi:hypothetical protein
MVVDFSFIFARFLGADDANQILAAPRINNAIDRAPNSPQSDPAQFAVLLVIVDALQSLIQKKSLRLSGTKPCASPN